MDIIFCGTPEFSVPPLAELIKAGHHIKAVFTQPDKRKGRGQQVQKTPVKIEAEKHSIPVYQPTSLKDKEVIKLLDSFNADLMVVVAYGLIIPQSILDLPKHGCWNIHASLLPRWRGAAPIHRAILAGDEQTGIAIMQMEAGLDTGPVYHMYPTDIRPDDTGQSLHDRLSIIGGEAIVTCVQELVGGSLPEAKSQNNELATYAHKLSKNEADIDWKKPAVELERQIRAFNPWPGSQAEINGEPVKLWTAKVIEKNSEKTIGHISNANKNQLIIQTGEGQLSLKEIQKAGKKRMDISAFMAAKQDWYCE
ncbi:MAG: methionyl-tRNA formyltransferase [Marinicella sp.]|nr:methionyl-tRNA formyltransferase [Xanthomonadales bacterium]